MSEVESAATTEIIGWRGRLAESDLWYSFFHSPVAMLAALVTVVMVLSAVFAPLVAPHDPFDLASIDLMDSLLPPAWLDGGRGAFPSARMIRAAMCFRRSYTARGFP